MKRIIFRVLVFCIVPAVFLSCSDDASSSFTTVYDYGYGGVGVLSTGLTWKKCLQGENNDDTCSGSEDIIRFCDSADNTCNGGTNSGTLVSGPAYDSCDDDTTGGRNWRVPTIDELEYFYLTVWPKNKDIFQDSDISGYRWSASSFSSTAAWAVSSSGVVSSASNKTSQYRVRCVSTGL